MKQTRREFIGSSSAAGVVLAADPRFMFKESTPKQELWYNKMRRCAQHNLNEYDPKNLDVDKWVKYWSDLKLDALVLTAGGFIAMYPTKL
ncbi:MAG: hypothetical protein WCJ23_08655, partial [Verrucomicrobiota bacterium]